ncbi:MobF family relaxase [Methylocella tundrae]|uniref:AAA domain-containing protein n=1 Tax=Methylocella tundrae TaxID=227605 RepID=A0A4U8Z7T2_METTU|nr:MobF family relaxase [Methylocella tundrae]WPP02795.1 MobF family relaxase [Methylocella tundrae]VFU17594.1 AAA domain-containing protein [Methylocella tundrae]
MLNFRKVSADSDGSEIRRYMTQDKPEPDPVRAIDAGGKLLESGEKLTQYYTGRGARASWRPDMPAAVAAAIGLADARQQPRDMELDRLFEAKRADNGKGWSQHQRKNSGFDFVFSPHKSVSLAAEFASNPAEAAAIRNAIWAANDDALRYAADDLALARKGHAGEKGADHGEIGWVTFAHDAARPTVAVQNGPDGATYLLDVPTAGDPHYHLHNFIPNMVVTKEGRVGSIDSRALSAHKVHEYGAYFQAQLADRLRALGVRTGYDHDEQAVVLTDIPEKAVTLFSKRDRQVIGDARKIAREQALDWDELTIDRKRQILHEASAEGRLGKTKDEAHEVWRQQAAEIGWTHDTVIGAIQHPALTDEDRCDTAYRHAAAALSGEFQTSAVIDYDRLRVHAARGLIAGGVNRGRDDVDRVVALLEARGFKHNGVAVSVVAGLRDGKLSVTHTEQIRIEQSLSAQARAAATQRTSSLSEPAILAAIRAVQKDDPGVQFTDEQRSAIYAIGRGGKLSLLTGVAGAGKTTLLRPLVRAWKDAGYEMVGMSTAWRQADALKDPGIERTFALQPLLDAIETGDFTPDARTVLVIDEVSQIGPRPMLKLLELQAQTGMTIKMLGDREQVQSIEAGDTIELLRRVLPKSAMPEVLISQRQKGARDLKIASLFRDGDAETAFEMKREDGTAHLVEGDYDQVVHKIADLYIERTDALQAADKRMGVTITTLTNSEASDISQAIRKRLIQRGAIGTDQTIHKAVYYRGEKAELFNMPIATGDKLRLCRKTTANIGGRSATIGNNGDIVSVVGKTNQGLALRNERGQVAEVDWQRLTDKKTGRLLVGFGRAFTIDAAQGMSTRGEHINALPHGTGAASAFKTYTAESRATGQTHTMISKAAVLGAVKRSMALGDATPVTDEDLWDRIAKDTSQKPYKALAIDLAAKAKIASEPTVKNGLSAHRRIERAAAATPALGQKIRETFDGAAAREAFGRQREALDEFVQQCAAMLKEAAETVKEHMNALRVAIRPDAAVHGAASPAERPPEAAIRPSPSPGP